MGENNGKWNSWQRVNFQNIKAPVHTSQYQKNKQPNQKWGKGLNRLFCKDIQIANKHMKRSSTKASTFLIKKKKKKKKKKKLLVWQLKAELQRKDTGPSIRADKSLNKTPTRASLVAVKNPPAMQGLQETQVGSLGREDPLEKGLTTHSSILAWRIPWTKVPVRLQSIGSQRVKHDWGFLARTCKIPIQRF